MKLLTVETFDNHTDAHLRRSKLESMGIKCFLFDENMISLNPLWNLTVGGIKLKIAENDLDQYIEISQELNTKPFLDWDDNTVVCPKCGSTKLIAGFKSFKGVSGILSLTITFLLMVYPIYYKTVFKCKDCSNEFVIKR